MSNNYFTVQENYKERFYQIPKIFFTNEKYKKLSNDTKIAYGILRDRVDLSIKNNWVDELGNIYFIYTVKHLEIILNCGNKKVIKIKNELEDAGLLEQKRLGLNKPNMLYLKKPIVTKEDIYIINNINADLNNTNESSQNTEMSKRHSNDTDISDTTTKKSLKSDSSCRKNYLKSLLKNEFYSNPTKAFIEKIHKLSENMSDELLEYAVNYASEKGEKPKQYLTKILEIWFNNNIYNLSQAKSFNIKPIKHSLKSKEKTPRWITHPEEYKLKEENDQNLVAEAQAFKEHLINKRRNYN
ncbi:TPA: replication initiator protein A [Staphylococcus aureus]